MSLKSALDTLPCDWRTEAGLRDVLYFFAGHDDEWETVERVTSVTALDSHLVERLLAALLSGFVLDFHDDPPSYRYHPDRPLDIEVRRFLRRADTHAGLLQANVERFRTRYGER